MMTDVPAVATEGAGLTAGKCVTVLFFASARVAAGTPRATFPADGSTVAQLVDELCCTFGDELKRVLASAAIWVNGSPATPATVLGEGDEVAVLPPVSGGCGSLEINGPAQRRRCL